MCLCLIQLLKTQDELERLRTEKQTLSSCVGEDLYNELQKRNTTLTDRVYVNLPMTVVLAVCFCSVCCIFIGVTNYDTIS